MTGIKAHESHTEHDGGEFSPVNVSVVATWPAPTFVENLAIDSIGAVFVSLYSHNRVDRYDPTTGTAAPFADLPAPPMGLAFDAAGTLWATGGTFREGPGYIWQIGPDGWSSTGPTCPAPCSSTVVRFTRMATRCWRAKA